MWHLLMQVRTDWASLIDNWAVRFLHEMDYTREAANAALFRSVVQLPAWWHMQ
jgi:predicted unusual protein kinase regulating ubiquinone biosynthesis (AarF/ABC1/UbiB family)